jgi:nucleotide-binding universal stress UspA family protein
LATAALKRARQLLASGHDALIVTVIDDADPMLVTGTGFAGGTMSPEAFDAHQKSIVDAGLEVLEQARADLGLPDAETRVVSGAPGAAIVDLAEQLSAVAIVLGTRGHGGLKRAVLGSVADHVVRNAPCSVVVGRPHP